RVVAAAVIGYRTSPEQVEDFAGFGESFDAFGRRGCRVAHHRVGVRVAARAEAGVEPAIGEVVEGRRDLRERARVAVGVAGDQAADAHSFRRFGHRGEQAPAVEDVAGALAAHRGEV